MTFNEKLLVFGNVVKVLVTETKSADKEEDEKDFCGSPCRRSLSEENQSPTYVSRKLLSFKINECTTKLLSLYAKMKQIKTISALMGTDESSWLSVVIYIKNKGFFSIGPNFWHLRNHLPWIVTVTDVKGPKFKYHLMLSDMRKHNWILKK